MRRFLLWLGLTVVTVAAVAASFSTLAGLAAFTGWGERLSWLLPASLDALGMTACLVWLDGSADRKSRDYARWLTWVAAGLSILGNGVGHLASTGHLSQGLLLVVLVGAVPPAALATTVHLIVLVSSPSQVEAKAVPVPDAAPVPAEDPAPVTPVPAEPLIGVLPMFEQYARTLAAASAAEHVRDEPDPVPAEKPTPEKTAAPAVVESKPRRKRAPAKSAVKSGPESSAADDEVMMRKARHLDEKYRAENGGKPITRDALKLGLAPCGTTKATALLAALKKEREAA